MICPNCGRENEEGSKFCIECGGDLTSKEISDEKRNKIELGGRRISSPDLLEKEKVLGEFRASFWDLGIVGFILRYKDKIIITTHRVLYFSRRVFGEYLKYLFLRKVANVEIGSKFNLIQFLIGVALLIFGIFGLHARCYGYGICTGGMPWYIRLVIILIAAILILMARKKILAVTTDDIKNVIAFPFIRMKKEETKRFIDLISKAREELEK